ncbi:hypothetical protein BCR35DRAFT_350554 [Leucosporidium creatinivorum]|uniref:WW domain-containing protein n=1 Tax=Leucosporidium creatinivorum TaxID=106004 RepID=A0A1Y2FYC4_9BASI|nr:hypothetical protein BCR35DRAFT_350554 [Leucosporidium creatinivorum]
MINNPFDSNSSNTQPPPYSGSGARLDDKSRGWEHGHDGRDGPSLRDDDNRELPNGWRREYDPTSRRSFYVQTNVNPPRSSWTHPLDPEYRSSLPDGQPQRDQPPPGPPPSRSDGASYSGGSNHAYYSAGSSWAAARELKEREADLRRHESQLLDAQRASISRPSSGYAEGGAAYYDRGQPPVTAYAGGTRKRGSIARNLIGGAILGTVGRGQQY